MNRRWFAIGAAALACSFGAAAHVSVGVGVSIGYPLGYGYPGGHWHRPWAPGYMVVAPPVFYGVPPPPAVVVEAPPVAVAPTKPDPVIQPRNGQSAQQTEYDRQQCNRWATTQQAALADAGVFQRAVEACMDGRGYTTK